MGVIPNSSRYYLDQFAAEAGQACPPGGRILDAGAGMCPYKGHFAHAEYESADICQIEREYGQITHVCDLRDIPVEDERFDFVFFSQALEHVPEPSLVLRELQRVMRPGAQMWLSVPLFYEEHEAPYDFYRYTQYGLRHLLDQAGFDVVSIEWLEGYFGTLSHQCKVAAREIPRGRRAYGSGPWGPLRWGFMQAMRPMLRWGASAFARMDLEHKCTDHGMCKNYRVVATRRDS